ncbi:hypothetical protein ScalyP_jg11028 [Parmales sp. scaly parma]|nr:hypothetical protein ScalyP_jg11028 [Parmales sp. scaly parma]
MIFKIPQKIVLMIFATLLLAILVLASDAFPFSPQGTPTFGTKKYSALSMVPVTPADLTLELQTVSAGLQHAGQLLSVGDKDFGGLLFPVGGLGLVAALILYLSPPLTD